MGREGLDTRVSEREREREMNMDERKPRERGKCVLSECLNLPSGFKWGFGFISKYQRLYHFAYACAIITNTINSSEI